MFEPEPSDDFLLFKPSWRQERLYVPLFCAVFVSYFLYSLFGLSYALFLSPLCNQLAWVGVFLTSTLVTLLALNVYWAYEGNITRRKKRPGRDFNEGSKIWCAFRHGSLALVSGALLSAYFHEAIPHAILHFMGETVVHELVVEAKRSDFSKFRRSCGNMVVAHSSLYRSDKLCLESDELYAEVNVGDTLVVEGKANWMGLLVSTPIALRDADSGLERSVGTLSGLRHFVQLEDGG